MNVEEVKYLITGKLKTKQPFAVFRLPGEKQYHLNGKDGYSVYVNDFNRPFTEAVDASVYQPHLFISANSFQDYSKAVKTVIDYHKDSDNSKTVIARVISGCTEPADIVENAFMYFNDNPDAFCLLLYAASDKVIVMATPELLLCSEGSFFRTMALAGTRRTHAADTLWDEKNLREQKIVEDFILRRLTECGASVSKVSKRTKQSNNIEHLCTDIEGILNHGDSDNYVQCVFNLLSHISPTPAVLGYPVSDSLHLLEQTEVSPRKFYSGTTIIKNNNWNISVFVNLRCAVIDMTSGRFAIYTGSGITKDSNVQDEWEETALKAAPLFNILT